MIDPKAPAAADFTARPLRLLLRTDGSFQRLEHPVSMRAAHDLIRAEAIDVVGLRHLGMPLHVMLVDDHGWEYEVVQIGPGHVEHRTTRPRKPINHAATELYLANCVPGTTHQIVGDVVIVPDEDYAG